MNKQRSTVEKIELRRGIAMIAMAVVMICTAFCTMTDQAMAFSGKKGSVYTVTSGERIVYGEGEGGYSNSKLTDLDDGLGTRYSYCVQPDKPSPTATRVTVDKVVTDDADTGKWNALRNIIYYSPSYPGYEQNVKNVRDNYYTGDFSKDWGIAHLALSYVYVGRPDDLATYNGTSASDLGEVWTKAKRLGNSLWKDGTSRDDAVPENFKVFISYMDGVQDMVVGYLEAPGILKITKTGLLASITENNDMYDLSGAEFTVYDDEEKARGTLTIGNNGESSGLELPAGTYWVKETTAPPGYALDTDKHKVKIESEETTVFEAEDAPITAKIDILIEKTPEGYPHDHGEGDASLKNAVFRVDYYDDTGNQHAMREDGQSRGKALATWYFLTDGNGKVAGSDPRLAESYTSSELYRNDKGKVVFPLGRYVIKEVKAPKGYILNDEEFTVTVTEDGTGEKYTTAYNSAEVPESIIRGGVKIFKTDAALDSGVPQGDASLEGAEFTIYNGSDHSVIVGGTEYAKGKAVMTITTDADGIAHTSKKALPYGTYTIKETKAPEGYTLNEDWQESFEIREDGVTVELTDKKVGEEISRSGIRVLKFDKELGKSEALGGASLEGIVMTIRNVSDHEVLVRKDLGSDDKTDWRSADIKALIEAGEIRRVSPGEDVGSIVIHWNEEINAYSAETLSDDLPYGTYTIRETATNDTYQRTDLTEHRFEVREDGKLYTEEDLGELLIFRDQAYRSDVQGTKIGDSTSERFGLVPFKITSLTNGESHVVVTDRNGFFTTKDRRTEDQLNETEGSDGTGEINPFDDLLEADEISIGSMEARAADVLLGVWFGTGEKGSTAGPSEGIGALPYDTYVLEELGCERNAGYTLQKFMFTVDQKSTSGLIDLETITDDVPEIGTVASVDGKNTDLDAAKTIKIIDTVEYSGLKRNEKYTVRGRLTDRATGGTVLDANGEEITAETEFTAKNSQGRVKVTFIFDGSNMQGMDTVVFERLYDSQGHLVAKHEDPDDDFQRLTWKEDKPEEPTEPEEPEEPDKPGKPDKPDKPSAPYEPDTPDKPHKPDTPDKPDKPERHDTPGTPVKTKVPKTGDELMPELWLMVFALSCTAALRIRLREE